MMMIKRGKRGPKPRTWYFVNKGGGLYSVTNISAFCYEHEIDQGGMSKMLNGKLPSVYGFTLPPEGTDLSTATHYNYED